MRCCRSGAGQATRSLPGQAESARSVGCALLPATPWGVGHRGHSCVVIRLSSIMHHVALFPSTYPLPPLLPQVLPADIREPLVNHPERASLLEVVLDLVRGLPACLLACPLACLLLTAQETLLDRVFGCSSRKASCYCHFQAPLTLPASLALQGRRPEARFLGKPGGQFLREAEVRPDRSPWPMPDGIRWAWHGSGQ